MTIWVAYSTGQIEYETNLHWQGFYSWAADGFAKPLPYIASGDATGCTMVSAAQHAAASILPFA